MAHNTFFLLSAQTYSVGGDSVRSLTEKLRAVAHTLQMSIEGRWRVNTSDGQSATKLSQQVLQAVVDMITASNGLVSLLNRWESQFRPQSNVYLHVFMYRLWICAWSSIVAFYSFSVIICMSVFTGISLHSRQVKKQMRKLPLCVKIWTLQYTRLVLLQCFKGRFHPKNCIVCSSCCNRVLKLLFSIK